MSCIVTTLKSYNYIRTTRKPVHNLTLALITPLRADHGYVRHKLILNFYFPIQLKELSINGFCGENGGFREPEAKMYKTYMRTGIAENRYLQPKRL
jgi:hypothetical protein